MGKEVKIGDSTKELDFFEKDRASGRITLRLDSLEALDGLVVSAAWSLFDSNGENPPSNIGVFIRKTLSEIIKEQAKKQKFHGQLKNIKATLLPPDPAVTVKLDTEINPDNVRTFLAEAEMHSSGWGMIGTVKRECGLTFRPRDENSHLSRVYMKTRAILGEKTQQQIEALLKQSEESAIAAWRIALSKTTSAGLPTLGKKR